MITRCFRHPDLKPLRDLNEEEPAEVRAGNAGLSYVKLEGTIGCLVNGAGLAMSTMGHHQVPRWPTCELLGCWRWSYKRIKSSKRCESFLSDPNVKGIFGQHFWWYRSLHHDRDGVDRSLEASWDHDFRWWFRLEGTEVQEGKKMLAESGLAIIAADDLTDAAKKIVAAVANALVGLSSTVTLQAPLLYSHITGHPNTASQIRLKKL